MSCLTYIFGDSVMKGVVLDTGTGRYKVLESTGMEKIGSAYDLELVNCSRFGSTILKGERTISTQINKHPDLSFAVLEYGGNDCDFDWKDVCDQPDKWHEPRTPLQEFLRIYRNVLEMLKSRNIIPVMMNLPPIDGQRYADFLVATQNLDRDALMYYLKDCQQIYRFQELYSMNIERMAHETGTLLVDCRSRFLDRCKLSDFLCEDGLHPNQAGHSLIYESFVDFLENLPEQLRAKIGVGARRTLAAAK